LHQNQIKNQRLNNYCATITQRQCLFHRQDEDGCSKKLGRNEVNVTRNEVNVNSKKQRVRVPLRFFFSFLLNNNKPRDSFTDSKRSRINSKDFYIKFIIITPVAVPFLRRGTAHV